MATKKNNLRNRFKICSIRIEGESMPDDYESAKTYLARNHKMLYVQGIPPH